MTMAPPNRDMKSGMFASLVALVFAALICSVMAQPAPLFAQKQQKKASELIKKQDPPKVIPRVLEKATTDNISIYISLGKQRAYLSVGDEIAVDSPISSGKRAGMTPAGDYKIIEKDSDHRSSVYGDFVSSRTGRVVRAGVSTRIDSAPSGTVYRGAPMRWFMRLTNDGVGMHTGILPGYPASHGCIRLPEEIAKLFYAKVKLARPYRSGTNDSTPNYSDMRASSFARRRIVHTAILKSSNNAMAESDRRRFFLQAGHLLAFELGFCEKFPDESGRSLSAAAVASERSFSSASLKTAEPPWRASAWAK